jgi:hypothetical protein
MHPHIQRLQILLPPHNPSNNRHNPLPAPKNRRERSLPNAAAARVSLSGVSEQRAGVPSRSCALATIENLMYRRQSSLKPWAKISNKRYVHPPFHPSHILHRLTLPGSACEQADYQFHALKLVLSTHLALFRSSNPLLLNFNDKLHQDLLGGHRELIKLAIKMRKVVVSFRERGFTDMKGSIAYRKEYFDLFRRVYDGL